jgi:hypothetical protein
MGKGQLTPPGRGGPPRARVRTGGGGIWRLTGTGHDLQVVDIEILKIIVHRMSKVIRRMSQYLLIGTLVVSLCGH